MRKFLILLPLFSFIIQSISAQEKKFHHFTSSEGLSFNTIYDIDQDQRGFVWVATGEGLNRYDSYGFTHYYSDTTSLSLPSNDARALLVTKKGKLFIGTSKGLCLFNPEYDNFSTITYGKQTLGNIRDLFETSKGKIMVVSGKGVYCASETGEVINRLPLENNFFQIQEDSNGNFWSFQRKCLYYLDEQGKTLKTFNVDNQGLPKFIPSEISTIKIDSHDRLWVGTFEDGPILFDANKNEFSTIPLKSPIHKPHAMYFVRDIVENPNGRYWICTDNGLFIYDLYSGYYEQYQQSFDPAKMSLNDNAINKVFKSQENMMWFGTQFGGLNYLDAFETEFKKLLPGIKTDDLKGKALTQMIKVSDGNIWVATEDAGIAIFDKQHLKVRHILNTPDQNNNLKSNNVHALAQDKEGNVWAGTVIRGIYKINPHNYQVRNFSNNIKDNSSLVSNFVFSLYFDSSDLLWIGTMNGIDCLEKGKSSFSHFKPEIFKGKFTYDIFQDNQNNYWFCTFSNGLYCYNKQTDKIIHYEEDSTLNLNTISFICHHIDTNGKLWFGTRTGGLVFFDPQTQRFRTFDMKNGLPNNCIYGILEDGKNNLWLSSNKGISKFNYKTGEIQNYNSDHGLVSNQFNYKSFLKTDDGTMYFGSVNGLSYFNPIQIKSDESKPKIYFVNFRLFNNPVKPGKNSILEKAIDFTDKIILKYNQNVISFDFIALNYHSLGKNKFFYYLEGYEPSWQSVGNQNSATYSNLLPGNYTFHIKATNSYDFPNELEKQIGITVLPPVWKTSWAYLIYTIFLFAIAFLLYRFNEMRYKEKMALKIEKINKEKLEELHQHKINFFTYISHEFKTPLTIIIASLDAFFSGDNIPNEFKNRIITIKKNALRLQLLITQLMDFRKIETDHATLNLEQGDVIQFLKGIFDAFITLFNEKKLNYVFKSQDEVLHISFDPDKLEKIVSNLLSNAFKYTPEYGQIAFSIESVKESDRSYLAFTVSNSGNVMTDEQLKNIFNIFYKIETEQNEYQGSGVGLTLTQSLVKFLNGKITVDSKLGKGTSFSVKLPYQELQNIVHTNNVSFNKTIIDTLLIQPISDDYDLKPENLISNFEILFVEDNRDLLKFMCEHFRKYYKVKSATNGVEALKSVQKIVPDLIVTDLMMPQMDGLLLCKELKTNFEYSHVPVIMLTSKSDIESRLGSLEVGADAYLSKPFHLSELELQIRNILISKSNLKQHFIKFGNLTVDHPIKNQDQQFIEKITSIILTHLDSSDFGINDLTKELGIGRTLIHTKLKQILDLSATEFINAIRLRQAKKILLENPNLTMAEIAYKVGFSDPNYFSRTFKKNFNISPTDYKNGNINSRV